MASSILLRALGSCESRVPGPIDAAQGDPAKGTADGVDSNISGLVLPMAKRFRLIDPISAQSDTNCLTLRENSPRTPTTRPIVGGIDRSKASTGQGSPFQTYSIPLNSRSALWALVSIVDWTTQAIGQQHTSPLRAGCEARRREIVVDWTTSTGLDYLSSSRTPTRALLDIQSGTSRRVCLFVV